MGLIVFMVYAGATVWADTKAQYTIVFFVGQCIIQIYLYSIPCFAAIMIFVVKIICLGKVIYTREAFQLIQHIHVYTFFLYSLGFAPKKLS